jgi:hypothetical protein
MPRLRALQYTGRLTGCAPGGNFSTIGKAAGCFAIPSTSPPRIPTIPQTVTFLTLQKIATFEITTNQRNTLLGNIIFNYVLFDTFFLTSQYNVKQYGIFMA